MNEKRKQAILVLADGTVFIGKSFGAGGETTGEVVFNTAMTGYQEILTDPSYRGQIVTMTYPEIGNYGTNEEDIESAGGPKAEGFIVKEYIDYPSNWRSSESLGRYLEKNGIVGIEGIDTRALTRILRDKGSQMGIISSTETDPLALYEKIREHPGIGGIDLVEKVSCVNSYSWSEDPWHWKSDDSAPLPPSGGERRHVVVYDYGVKFNILRNLHETGFDLTVVPGNTPAEAVLDLKPDAIFLSNGPGDPEAVTYAVESTRKLIHKLPVFGICLGHQIIGLALGGRTYKLKFGHHGGNHPVMDYTTGKVEITSQNHNYCVDMQSLGDQVELTHRNLYDGTEEGLRHVDLPLFCVQYHPEAGPGPNDSLYLFRRFRTMVG